MKTSSCEHFIAEHWAKHLWSLCRYRSTPSTFGNHPAVAFTACWWNRSHCWVKACTWQHLCLNSLQMENAQLLDWGLHMRLLFSTACWWKPLNCWVGTCTWHSFFSPDCRRKPPNCWSKTCTRQHSSILQCHTWTSCWALFAIIPCN